LKAKVAYAAAYAAAVITKSAVAGAAADNID
jgi:hypothetical protein